MRCTAVVTRVYHDGKLRATSPQGIKKKGQCRRQATNYAIPMCDQHERMWRSGRKLEFIEGEA